MLCAAPVTGSVIAVAAAAYAVKDARDHWKDWAGVERPSLMSEAITPPPAGPPR